MRDFSKNRSDRYQWLILEMATSPEKMVEYAETFGFSGRINNIEYSESLCDLQEQLRLEFWRVVETNLTPRQKQVLKLHCDGYTQTDIAKMLNVNQSSITKSMNGNCDYKGGGKKVYGGAKKKLKKLIEKDAKIKQILDEIRDLKE